MASSIGELTKFRPDYQELYKELQKFDQYPDTHMVMIGVAYLDKALEFVLRDKFIEESGSEQADFFDKGLKNFSAKIDLAFALGLISSQMKDDLNNIRKIRNAFAHASIKLDFDKSEIKDVCSQLKSIYRETEEFDFFRSNDLSNSYKFEHTSGDELYITDSSGFGICYVLLNRKSLHVPKK